jgi:hypothetical protein
MGDIKVGTLLLWKHKENALGIVVDILSYGDRPYKIYWLDEEGAGNALAHACGWDLYSAVNLDINFEVLV